jgi:hypothetical protein
VLDQKHLLCLLQQAESELPDVTTMEVPSRTVYLPLAWEDSQTQLATERYMQTVRPDAPWCPDNIEFIRRINGLDSKQAVKDIVFSTNYLVMGLGDVYSPLRNRIAGCQYPSQIQPYLPNGNSPTASIQRQQLEYKHVVHYLNVVQEFPRLLSGYGAVLNSPALPKPEPNLGSTSQRFSFLCQQRR